MLCGMDAICSHVEAKERCDRRAVSRGLCQMHYMRVWRHGDVNRGRPVRQVCSADDCGELSDAKGMCHRHYEMEKRRAAGAKVGSRAPRGSFTPCTAEDHGEPCGKPVVSNGLCRKHHMRLRRKGTTADPVRPPKPTCTSPEGCPEPQVGQGLCRTHYMRIYMREHRPASKPYDCAWCGGPSSRKPRNGISYCSPKHKDKAYAASGKHAETARKSYLKRKYGLTLEEFVALAELGCTICGTTEWMGRHGGRPHVDHDHETGEVRGVLCHLCNLMIGYAKEQEERLSAGIQYLRDHPKPNAT